ncbi:hypothetical protein PP613_23570 [Mycobacteroides abscessus]|nr:hypothetical protein [Mycobacteroides abscessus]MDM2412323.1 hypothetical protein [Mycobacteroides abscessus]
MSTDDPNVEAPDVTPSGLAEAKAAINGFRARYQRGEISSTEIDRVFAGVPRRRDDPGAAGVLFIDEAYTLAVKPVEDTGHSQDVFVDQLRNDPPAHSVVIVPPARHELVEFFDDDEVHD